MRNRGSFAPVVVGAALVALGVRWALVYRQSKKMEGIARRKRIELAAALENARATLPPRPSPEVEALVLSLHAHQLAAAIKLGPDRPKGLSAVVVMTVYCHRALDAAASFNVVSAVCFEEALAAAAAADARIAADPTSARPLEGVPLSVKDSINQAGHDSTCGIAAKCFHPSSEDGLLVALLRDAGAIPFVRSTVPALLLLPDTVNGITGQSVNPWNSNRVPGGSSGGEGALLAARASPLGIGTDIGGSVRIPAAFCGVYGFKPTPQRLTLKGLAAGSTLKYRGNDAIRPTAGPIGRCVEDCVVMMRALLSPRAFAEDPFTPPVPLKEQLGTGPLRIGYFADDGYFSPAPACARAVTEAVSALSLIDGVTLVPFQPPNIPAAVLLYYTLMSADGGALLFGALQGESLVAGYDKLSRVARMKRTPRAIVSRLLRLFGQKRPADILSAGGEKSALELFTAVSQLKEWTEGFMLKWREAGIDALLCPSLALPAFGIGEAKDLTPALSCMFLFNLLHFPAGVAPVTTVRPTELVYTPPADQKDFLASAAARSCAGSEGLPVAVQIAALPYQDETVLRVMAMLESRLPPIRFAC